MIGSGPLMLVNDFLTGSSLSPYALFDVTPAGLLLLIFYLAFFLLLGRIVLPRYNTGEDPDKMQTRLVEDWGLYTNIRYYRITGDSSLIGKSLENAGIWDEYNLNVLAVNVNKSVNYAPWRETRFETEQIIALLGKEENAEKFASYHKLTPVKKPEKFKLLDDTSESGFAEIVVPPRSAITGQSIKTFGLRRQFGVEPVLLYHNGEKVRGNFSNVEITPGDILIVHGLWEKIADMNKGHDFVVITPVEVDEKDDSKAWTALLCFAASAVLAMTGFSIPVSFMSGAMAMILTGVLNIDEAYKAVDWKVVFFMAGLIPLGTAMQKTGTAVFLAGNLLSIFHDSHLFVILLGISLITTLFSVFMSNVGAAVILFPMVISIANSMGIDPRPLALLVAVSTSNSFLLPTHQVNALYKTPGGYRNTDYLKSGGGLTILYLLVATATFYFFYI
jgi:di/tricarboxylate transporter